MSVFVDTAGLIAVLDDAQPAHEAAKALWFRLLTEDEPLVTTNYVLVETLALVQRRYGMRAVRLVAQTALPALAPVCVDQPLHESGLHAFLQESRRGPSLVDCVSFIFMREQGLARVFTLDPHFADQGFEVLP